MRTEFRRRAAWDLLLAGITRMGWKVVRRADCEAIYTTSAGRVGTLTLKPYLGGKPRTDLWRWTVDYYSVRWPRRNEMAMPEKPHAAQLAMVGGNELTCAEVEVVALGEWLVAWLSAYDAGAPLPEGPGFAWRGGYLWTPSCRAPAPPPAEEPPPLVGPADGFFGVPDEVGAEVEQDPAEGWERA
jgi:hypothetical protein